MKSFQNIVAVACTLASLSFANAGAITSASASPTKVHSTARTSSGSASPTAVATSSPTIVTMSSSILPPTSTPSNGIGGFVVTGIYTTCLTVTFSDAASSTATSLPTTSVVEGSTSTFVTPTASVEADVKRQAITSSTVLDSESTSTSIAIVSGRLQS
ncbi:hypothetical protein B0H10DRAFT_524375 [Mycena sp. CBHHK59/15]|nr:hypothetical protein B0H10DRAFT_524375 [Mycena sp. CBHHK59/15]